MCPARTAALFPPSAPPRADVRLPKVGLAGSQGAPPGVRALTWRASRERRPPPPQRTWEDWGGPSSRLPSALRGSVCFESQTPEPQSLDAASGRSVGAPAIRFRKRSPPGVGTLPQGAPSFTPCLCPLSRLWLQGGSIFSSCRLHVSWTPGPGGVTFRGHRPLQNRQAGQTVIPAHSGSRLAGRWRETTCDVSAAPQDPASPPPPPPPLCLCWSPVPQAPVKVTHQREACPRCRGYPAWLPAPVAPTTHG